MAIQLYAGTKKLISSQKPSLFNAIQHTMAKENCEACELQKSVADIHCVGPDVLTGKQSEGRDTLPNLASKIAEKDYRNLPFEEKQAYLNGLEEHQWE